MARRIQKKKTKSLNTKKLFKAMIIPLIVILLFSKVSVLTKTMIQAMIKIDEAFLSLMNVRFYSEGNKILILIDESTILTIFFTKDCIGLTPLSLMLMLLLLSNTKDKSRKMVIYAILIFSVLIVNIFRILTETYVSIKKPEISTIFERFLFPLFNIVYVFLVWFFMLQRKYIYIDIWQRKG
ncbi:MAG: hypothetical protein J7K83_01060 [Candidatus Aenigmarchaeota archaeon]|nr:hypothetical protein [Candidatus Aenigmarchaeota archaeon]